jgi:hypothetical protein
MSIAFPDDHPKRPASAPQRSPAWEQHASRIDPSPNARPTGWLCLENRALPITEIDLLEIVPGRGLLVHTRVESWLVSLPAELQSGELLKAITSGEVNSLSGFCEPYESSSESSKSSNSDNRSVLEFE